MTFRTTKIIPVRNTSGDKILLILVSISFIKKNSPGFKLAILCPGLKQCFKKKFDRVKLVTSSCVSQKTVMTITMTSVGG